MPIVNSTYRPLSHNSIKLSRICFIYYCFYLDSGGIYLGGGDPYVLYIIYRFLTIALNTRTFSLLANIMFGV